MLQERKLLDSTTTKLFNFIALALNPNHLIIKIDTSLSRIKQDIRSSSSLRLSIKKVFYLFRSLFLILSDNVAVAISWLVMAYLYRLSEVTVFSQGVANISYLFLLLTINVAIFISSGLYSTRDNSRRIGSALFAYSLSFVLFITIAVFFEELVSFDLSSIILLGEIWLLGLFLICGERFLVFTVINYVRSRFSPLRRKFLLVGTVKDLLKCQQILKESSSFSVVETLVIDSSTNKTLLDEMYQTIATGKVDEIVICSWEELREQTKIFWGLQTAGISWRILAVKTPIPQREPELANVEGVPTIRYKTSIVIGSDFLIKRIFDLCVACFLVIVFGIPMLLIGLAILLDSPGSIFYKQTRVGLKGEHFQVWKFRTMVENAGQLQKELESRNEVDGGILFKISDDPRITKLGKILRRYSLDELPQLINVLRGEMSLVGPRPLPIRDVEKFQPYYHFRHEILPGITGLWQVSGRSDTNSEKVFNLDFKYIQDWSLALDIKVLLKTIQVVLFGKGAY